MKRYRHPTEIPRSREIVGLEWIGERVPVAEFGVRGDTYPMTWGADDEIYMGTGDPNWFRYEGKIYNGNIPQRPELDAWVYQRVSGHVFEKLTGTPEKFGVERIHDFPGQTGWGGSGPKPSGLISVDGVLYYAVQNLLGWKPARYETDSQHGSDATILRSADGGRTWTPDLDGMLADYYKKEHTVGVPHHEAWKTAPELRTQVGNWTPMFPGSWFGGPSFVQFGKDNANAVDEYVYAISTDQWDNGTELRLGRVSKDAIMDRSAWEFAIPQEDGGVEWTKKLYLSRPVLAIENHISMPEMVYLNEKRKYLLLTWALHENFHASAGSELTVLEADHPWGPFYLVSYEWMWGRRAGGHYCPRIPLKWFNQKTLTGAMVYSGNWETQIPYYMPQARMFQLLCKEKNGGQELV